MNDFKHDFSDSSAKQPWIIVKMNPGGILPAMGNNRVFTSPWIRTKNDPARCYSLEGRSLSQLLMHLGRQ